MEIPILYEDSDIVAINKSPGLVIHGDGKTIEPSLADWVLDRYPQTKEVGESIIVSEDQIIKRPGIVHRLDRETSGVLLIAKTKEGYTCLKAQFKSHTILKKYLALVYGEMKEIQGIIDRPIGRSTSDFRKWSATRGTRGEFRQALTQWTLLEKKGGYSFVEVVPKTGRTHQIRVHFKAINHPIVCDKLYASSKECLPSLNRLALHAFSISFKNVSEKEVTVKAPLPDDFKLSLENLHIIEIAKNRGLC